ncbi:MAG: S1 RNA-binding domain-containing protein [Candidatus Caldarchaeum sp.]
MSKAPELGELVIGKITSVRDYGAYVEVEEYPGYEGFVHVSEVSLKWVLNIREHLKEGQRTVLKIIRVNPQTFQIDLSIRRVSQKERIEKLLEVKKKAKVAKVLKVLEDASGLRAVETLLAKFPDPVQLYEVFEKIAVGEQVESFLQGLSKAEADALKKAVEQEIKVREFEVKVDVILRCDGPKGVEAIRLAAEKAEQVAAGGEHVEIKTKGAPVYSLHVKASSRERASELVSQALQACRAVMAEYGGVAQLKTASG